MNSKKFYLILGFLVFTIIGGLLGFRNSFSQREQNQPPFEIMLSKRQLFGKKSPTIGVLFSNLKKASDRADSKELETIHKQWISICSLQKLEGLIELVDEEPDSIKRGLMMTAIAARWAELDPDAAISYITDRVHSKYQGEGFVKIFEVLALSDPATAFDSIKRLRQAESGLDNLLPAFSPIFQEWKKNDLSAAFAALKELDNPEDLYVALHILTQAQNDSDRELVFERIRTLDNPATQNSAWKEAISSWAAQASLDTVSEWILSQPFDCTLVSLLEREAAIQYGNLAPQKMANWLLDRADEDNLSGHLEAAVQFWAAEQPYACGEWLNQLNPGPHMDRAIASYSKSVFQHDPDGAFNWAQAIQSENNRDEILGEVSRRFYSYDPQGFFEAVAESDLPEDRRQKLLERARQLPSD